MTSGEYIGPPFSGDRLLGFNLFVSFNFLQ